MALILNQNYEGAGYDNGESWSEVVGTGCTCNEDASIPGTPPANAGSQCLNMINASTGYYAQSYHTIASAAAISYTRVYFYIQSHSLADTNSDMFLRILNSAYSDVWRILYVLSGANLVLGLWLYNNGALTFQGNSGIVTLGGWHYVEVQYDYTNKVAAWKLDGSQIGSDIPLIGTLLANCWFWSVGADWASSGKALNYYVDLYKVDNTTWVGPEAGGGVTIPTISETINFQEALD